MNSSRRLFIDEALDELAAAEQAYQSMFTEIDGIPEWSNREEVTYNFHNDRADIFSRLAVAASEGVPSVRPDRYSPAHAAYYDPRFGNRCGYAWLTMEPGYDEHECFQDPHQPHDVHRCVCGQQLNADLVGPWLTVNHEDGGEGDLVLRIRGQKVATFADHAAQSHIEFGAWLVERIVDEHLLPGEGWNVKRRQMLAIAEMLFDIAPSRPIIDVPLPEPVDPLDAARDLAPKAVLVFRDPQGRILFWEPQDLILSPGADITIPLEIPVRANGIKVADWKRLGQPIKDGNLILITVDASPDLGEIVRGQTLSVSIGDPSDD